MGKCACGLQGRESEEGSWGHGGTQGTLLWWVRGTGKRVPGRRGCQLRHEDWHSTPPPPVGGDIAEGPGHSGPAPGRHCSQLKLYFQFLV